MVNKYSLEEIRNNLIKLKKRLEKRELIDGFVVIATRSDFKPLMKEVTYKEKSVIKKIKDLDEIRKYLIKGKERYFEVNQLGLLLVA
jgi:hypothetical protein